MKNETFGIDSSEFGQFKKEILMKIQQLENNNEKLKDENNRLETEIEHIKDTMENSRIQTKILSEEIHHLKESAKTGKIKTNVIVRLFNSYF